MRIFDVIFIMALIPFAVNISCALEVGDVSSSSCLLKGPNINQGTMNTTEIPGMHSINTSQIDDPDSGEGSYMTPFSSVNSVFEKIGAPFSAGKTVLQMGANSLLLGSTLKGIWSGTMGTSSSLPDDFWNGLNFIGGIIYVIGGLSILMRLRLDS